jgi:phosphate starvation-inducible PhoH-like protein
VQENYHAEFRLEPEDNRRLAWLCGPFDETLHAIERRLRIAVHHRGHSFRLSGAEAEVLAAMRVLHELYEHTNLGPVDGETLHLLLQAAAHAAPGAAGDEGPRTRDRPAPVAAERRARPRLADPEAAETGGQDEPAAWGASPAAGGPGIRTRRGTVRPRGPNQTRYLSALLEHDVSFGVGPAGTGKTYLAVAAAVEALESERVRRLVLTRPAVEAGERLGFLPGDMAQKVDPYLRPLYDALFEMIGFDRVGKLMERGTIEVAPLAFMRGRTLNESFIILDEAQNTTVEQMKMFLTRIGFGSRAVITGDITQVDLPRSQLSGLRQAVDLLQGTEGIHFTFFSAADVVRHPVVARILNAYAAAEGDGAGA